MKKIRDNIQHHILCADRKWKALPKNRQRLLTKLCFACYAVLTLLALVSIVISTGNKTNTMLIDHIRTISDHISVEKVTNDNHTNVPLKK